MKLDTIITGDSAEVLQSFPDACIDLTVTSPPYDNLRTYNGFTFDFETIAKQLYRVTKTGGVVVWVVGDATINGSETGTSFRQALYFMQCGFKLHDTMIYEKAGCAFPSSNRYNQIFEYMFIFSKDKPKTSNLIKDKKNKWAGQSTFGNSSNRQKDGTIKSFGKRIIKDVGLRNNIWRYANGAGFGQKDKSAYSHPATFPEALAHDHIISWSNEGDTVLDCFCGSGTTPKMAKLANRHYIGIEISEKYTAVTNAALFTTPSPLFGSTV